MSHVNENDTDIIIPPQHYVAFGGVVDGLPRGYMTHYTDDAKGRKRQETVNRHANRSKDAEGKIIDNKPMSGFKFGKVGSGWGTNYDQVWQIEDPRGFQMVVSSQNVAQVMACCTLENGEILEKCVWGRHRTDNVLIPVSSKVYKDAEANTNRISTRVDLRTVKPGQKVLTHDAMTGIYMGSMFPLTKSWGAEATHLEMPKRKRFIFVETKANGDWQQIHVLSEIKISQVLDATSITPEDAEKQLNAKVGMVGISTTGYGSSNIKVFSLKEPTSGSFELFSEPKTWAEVQILQSQSSYGTTILVNLNGMDGHTYATCDIGAINRAHYHHTATTVTVLDEKIWEDSNLINYKKSTTKDRWSYSRTSNVTVEIENSELPKYTYGLVKMRLTVPTGETYEQPY